MVCLAFGAKAWAQQAVSGRITGVDNAPLAGVSVVLKGTNTGASTNADGRYTINLPGSAGTLVFTYVGYQTTEKQVSGDKLDVRLQEDAQQIEDVVVIGYGTVRKSDLTGSVASVKIDQIEASQVTSFDKLLQGKAAGVQVVTGTAAPGGSTSITIRGMSSFNGTGEPLYVVDGIILGNGTQDVNNPMGSTGQEKQNALSSINPQDIANMEILKDASATAIYGSLGANGVILITTKSGASDTPRIEWTSSVEISAPSKKIAVLDLNGFIQYSEAVGYKKILADTVTGMDWQDYTMRTAVSQSHRLTISGKGKNNANYYIAAGFMNNQGLLQNTDVTQGDLRVNYDQGLGKYVKIGTKLTLTNRVNNMTQGTEPGGTQNATRATNMMRQMLGSKPYQLNDGAIDYDDDELKGTDIWLQNYEDLSKEYRINALAYADVSIAKWLKFKSTFGMDYRNKARTRWYGPGLDNGLNCRGGIAELNSIRYNLDNVLTASKKFGGHRIDAMVGTTVNYNLNQNNTIDASDFPGYPDCEFRTASIYAAGKQKSSYSESSSALVSYFTRLLYNYKERYVLTATFRADGSSRFSQQNRFSYFPSFAFAWRVNEESFLRNVRQISGLKLRVGWGKVGDQTLSPFQTLTTYDDIKMANPLTNYNLSEKGTYLTGVKPSRLANPDLNWETTEQYNAGVDLALLDSRINLTVDLYKKNTKDLLQEIEIPLSTGFTTQWVNRGEIENRGIELSLDLTPVRTKNFDWSVAGNISFNRNKVIDTGLPPSMFGVVAGSGFEGKAIGNDATYFKMPANIYLEGRPIALFWGFKTDGLVQQSDVDAGNLPTYMGKKLQAGDIKYVDLDGNGNINDGDKCIIGDPNPDFIYGFSTNFSYKSLSLSVVFNGSYGNQIVNGNLMQENDTAPGNPKGNINNIRAAAFFDRWTETNTATRYPRLNYTNNSGDFTDRIVEDGSYMRLASITLSYSIPLKAKWIQRLGVSFTARNPFIWTNYSGWDPDVSSFASSSQKVGVDWGSYPSTRSYIFGLSATF